MERKGLLGKYTVDCPCGLIMENSNERNALRSVEDGENESHQLINKGNSGDNIYPALSTLEKNNFQYDQYQDSEISSP